MRSLFATTTAAMAMIPAALALLPGAAVAQAMPAAPLPDGTILDVTAVGRVTATPDVATVRAGVVTQDATAATAVAQNAQRMAQVVKALRAAGVAARDIATSNVGLAPQYRYTDNQPPVVTGYQATNSVTVRFRDIAASGAVLDALVTSGANQIDGPAMSLSKPDAALDTARTDAVARARARAELYARAAGLRIDRIVSISENGENDGGSPTPPMMFRARAMAAQDAATVVLPGETDVTVTLAVRFLLK
jgi:uncharacterized protein YggE